MPAGPSPRHFTETHAPEVAENPRVAKAPKPSKRSARVTRWFADRFRHGYGYDPAAYDVPFAKEVAEKVRHLYGPGKYFDLQMRGLENVPDRPSMIVCNHSGGTVAPDVWGMGIGWYNHFGMGRRLYFLCHELVFTLPFFARQFERIGALRASNDVARRILAAGHDVLVYPGGDADVWRPYSKRYEIDFQGRSGFARLAKEMNAPIVPVAHAGSHEGLRVLTSGRSFARAVGLHKIARVEIWPVSLSLPWGLALGPLPHIPPPGRYRYLVGKAIDPDAAAEADDLAGIAEGAIQRNLDALKDEDTVH